jgi:hypothetical protein
MSDENKPDGRKAKARGQPHPAVPKRRGRLPVNAALQLDDSLPPNDHHPLAAAAPEVRAASRLRLIAGVLARLVRTDLARKA